MENYWQKMGEELGERVGRFVMNFVESRLDRYFKQPAKITFTEREAAEFLGVGVDSLQRWRRDGLINFCNYPLAKKSETNTTGLSSIYSYDLADLLDFRARYKKLNVPPKFRLSANVTVFGAEVEPVKSLKKAA